MVDASPTARYCKAVETDRPSLLQEIAQRRPFHSPQQEAIVSLLRTTDLVRRVLQSVMDPSEVTPQQYNVLRILRGAGVQGLPTLGIAARMIEQTPGITRLIDKLDAKGLVRRQRSTEDRREVRCFITEAALALLSRLDPLIEQRSLAATQELSQQELESLLSLLDKIRASCREALGHAPAAIPTS